MRVYRGNRPVQRSMLRFLLFLLVSLWFSSALFAQTATLRGVITDQSGAVVPGATVTLTGVTGSPRTTAAINDGSYSIAGIAPGDYTVQAFAPELATEPVKIAVKSGVQNLNLRLKVATLVQRLTVEENAASITSDPANNASATVIGGDDLQALSDNPDDLIAELQAIAGPGAGPGGASIFIDGFGAGGQLPSKESIREIRINQNPFSPEYDRLGAGRIEIVTRPGTNQFHSSGFFNFANDFWNSRNPYAQQKAPFLLKEYGGNLSGPMGRRASLYLDVRRDSVDNGANINGTTLDPSTLGIVNPFTDVFRIPQRRWSANPRVDYQLTPNNTLTTRYSFTHADIPYLGIGGFNLRSRGYRTTTTSHTLQLTETSVLAENVVNEIRFQLFRSGNERTANTPSPAIQVLGSFNGGGAQLGHSFDTQNNLEFQDYTSMIHRTHTWRFGSRLRRQADDNISPQNFGGTFTFGGGVGPALDANNRILLDSSGQPLLAPITSIERYRRTVLLQQLGYSAALIRSLGGGSTQFSISSGDPSLTASQFDIGAFIGDEWRIRPSFTLTFGLRYETQTNIHDRRDFAPRVGLAWGPGASGGKSQSNTVVRAGFGVFYDRFGLPNTLTARRYNGTRQQQYVIQDPDFFPSIPAISSLAGLLSTQIRQQVSPILVAPSVLQSTISIERQVLLNTTLAVAYTNSHGLRMLRSRDVNAPLPGTYDPNVPGSGVFPLGITGAVFLMESSGRYNQNQFIVNVNTRANRTLSLFGSYTLNRALSDTDGLGTFPSNPYSLAGEYGPAATDVRQRMNAGGSINTRWNVTFSPLLVVESGPPFDITAGRDIYGTTLFNGRPGIATDPNRAGLIETPYGLLNPNPTPEETILHRNYGRGPGSILANLRLTKTIKFGPERAETSRTSSNSPGGGNISRPYNLTISMSARNILNHTNPGPIIGNITSPLFGHANQPAGGAGGFGGFSENANNRQLELQIRVTF